MVLATCDGVRTIHYSRVRGSLANIDHVAIGPRGIFVIDAKHYAGKIEKRDVGAWFRGDERLFVRGRDRTKLAEAMERQVDVVSRALGSADPSVCITPVLCFVDAEWPLLRRPLRVRGVTVIWPRALAKLVTSAGALSASDVDRLAAEIGRTLPPACPG